MYSAYVHVATAASNTAILKETNNPVCKVQNGPFAAERSRGTKIAEFESK